VTDESDNGLHESMGDLERSGVLPTSQRGMALELAIRIGDLLQSSGQSANDSVVVMRNICRAYGLKRVFVDITSNAIVASYYPGGGREPMTAMRTVEPARPDLTKTAALNRLVADIRTGEPLAKAVARFDTIRGAATPYPRWAGALGNSAIGLFVQLLHTANPIILVIALIMGIGLNRLLAFLTRRSMPAFFQQMAGGWLIVAVTAATSWAGTLEMTTLFRDLDPTLIAAGGIVQLVVGMKFVAAGQDAIDGFYVTATARLLQVTMLTAGIVAGLVSGLALAARLGVFVYISTSPITVSWPVAQYFAVVGMAACFSIGNFANWRTVALTSAGAALAWFGFHLAQAAIGGTVSASFIGALGAAFVTTMLVRRTSLPGFAIVNGTLLPLVPGMRLYNGLIQTVGTNLVPASPNQGLGTLMVAAGIALAIAAGASLGMFIGRPVGDRLMELPLAWYGHLRRR